VTDSQFGTDYAAAYDALYGEKDYEAECDLLEQVFSAGPDREVRTVLDLGCGTGAHAIRLAQRGFAVTGVDVSSEMLARARAKAAESLDPATTTPPVFRLDDVRSLDLGRTFDAVVMMFAVLGYQTSNDDLRSALAVVRRHLRKGGPFVCDVWYGPAVLTQRPGERVKVVDTPEGQWIRTAISRLDTRKHLCSVDYRVWELRNGSVAAAARETHSVRYFFPMELEAFLEDAGLRLHSLTAFPSPMEPAGEESWNALVVAT
jgi:SAM-dependent methyltransferase